MTWRIKGIAIILTALAFALGSWIFLASDPTTDDDSDFTFVSEKDSSFELIDKASKTDAVDEETALLYKAYALFGDERLPVEYASDVVPFESHVLDDIRGRLSRLSPESQKVLAPFLKRPDDPDSYVNQRFLAQQEAGGKAAQNSLISTAYAARPHMQFSALFPSDRTVISADNRVKIWYPADTSTAKAGAYQQMANAIKKELDQQHIMQRFASLLARNPVSDMPFGGDDKLDIYIMPGLGVNGMAPSDAPGYPSSAYVMINANLMNDPRYLRNAVAHEIFHVFQAAFKLNPGYDKWWREASATWSENFIYSKDDTEQERLKLFFPYPKTSLDSEVDPQYHEYGAYIFAYYLTQNLGDSMMKKIHETCEAYSSCLKAIDVAIPGGFKKHWREFTLWNYNKEPSKKYTDPSGHFSPKSSIDSVQNKKIDIEKDEKDIDIDELEWLSAQLVTATNNVDRGDVKKVEFSELDKFTSNLDGASIKAIVYFKDKAPAVEDWTDKKQRTFCIDCGGRSSSECKEEDFEKVVLVFANGHRENMLPASTIKVEGKEPACSGSWKGMLKVTQTMTLPMNIRHSWTVVIKEELEEVEVGKVGNVNPLSALKDPTVELEYHVMKQDITFDYLESHIAGPVTGKGHAVREHPHPQKRGTLIKDDHELDTVVRFIKMKDYSDKGVQAVLGHGEYYLLDDDKIYGDCNFVTYSHDGVKCPRFTYETGQYFIGGDAFRGIEVTPTDNNRRFKGSKSTVDPIMGRVKVDMWWDYQRVFE